MKRSAFIVVLAALLLFACSDAPAAATSFTSKRTAATEPMTAEASWVNPEDAKGLMLFSNQDKRIIAPDGTVYRFLCCEVGFILITPVRVGWFGDTLNDGSLEFGVFASANDPELRYLIVRYPHKEWGAVFVRDDLKDPDQSLNACTEFTMTHFTYPYEETAVTWVTNETFRNELLSSAGYKLPKDAEIAETYCRELFAKPAGQNVYAIELEFEPYTINHAIYYVSDFDDDYLLPSDLTCFGTTIS